MGISFSLQRLTPDRRRPVLRWSELVQRSTQKYRKSPGEFLRWSGARDGRESAMILGVLKTPSGASIAVIDPFKGTPIDSKWNVRLAPTCLP